jgi:hypothetical protein
MKTSDIKTLADVRSWLRNDVEWNDISSEEMGIACVEVLEKHLQLSSEDGSREVFVPITPSGIDFDSGYEGQTVLCYDSLRTDLNERRREMGWSNIELVRFIPYSRHEAATAVLKRQIRRLQLGMDHLEGEIESDRITDLEMALHERLEALVKAVKEAVEIIDADSEDVEPDQLIEILNSAVEKATASPVVHIMKCTTELQTAKAKLAELEDLLDVIPLPPSDDEWLILCLKHSTVRDCLNWWRQNGTGYTFDIMDAGIYTKEQAFHRYDKERGYIPVPRKLALAKASFQHFIHAGEVVVDELTQPFKEMLGG